ncbi:MAG: anaerobic ribonucleoside-triphosphate reductase activating protein [Candidatus Omnitrophota bacterium]
MNFNIRGFNPTTMIDWPDRIASVIYIAGCNFRCPYCHASRLVKTTEKLVHIPFLKIKEFLTEKKDWIEGVVIGGGEPTTQPHLLDLLAELKSMALPVKIDTNGTNPRFLETIIKKDMVEYIAMDIKAPLYSNNRFYIQAAQDPLLATNVIKESIKIIMNSRVNYEFRTTVVPTILEKADIINIARDISGAKLYVLQQFVPRDVLDPELLTVISYPKETLEEMARLAAEFVERVICRI